MNIYFKAICIALVAVAVVQIIIMIIRNKYKFKLQRAIIIHEDEEGNTQIPIEPCPFCGKNVCLIFESYDETLEEGENAGKKEIGYSVVCDIDHEGCGCSTGVYDNPKEAIIAWNTRVKYED